MSMEKLGSKETVDKMINNEKLEANWDLFSNEATEAKRKFISWMLEDLKNRDNTNSFSDQEQSLTDQLRTYWEHWGAFLKEEQIAKNKFFSWVEDESKKQLNRISVLEAELKTVKGKNKSLMEENFVLIRKESPKDNKPPTTDSLEKTKVRVEDSKRKPKSNTKTTSNTFQIDDPTRMNKIETTPIKEMNLERKDKNHIQPAPHNNILLRILTENVFYGHQGFDLYESKKIIKENNFQDVQVNKNESLKEVKIKLGNALKFDPSKMRLWPIARRTPECLRPYAIDSENNQERQIIELLSDTKIPLTVENVGGLSSWVLFLEDVNSKNHLSRFTRFNMDTDIVLFLKYYDPLGKRMYFMGHLIISMQSKITELIKELILRAKQRRLGMDQLTEDNIFLYKESEPNVTVKIEKSEWEESLENIGEEVMDGDILVFQKNPSVEKPCKFPTIQEYFADYYKSCFGK